MYVTNNQVVEICEVPACKAEHSLTNNKTKNPSHVRVCVTLNYPGFTLASAQIYINQRWSQQNIPGVLVAQ